MRHEILTNGPHVSFSTVSAEKERKRTILHVRRMKKVIHKDLPTCGMNKLSTHLPVPRVEFRLFSTSGAKYCGVPQKVLRPSLVVRLANPKSVSLTSTSDSLCTSRMFSGLRSRCTCMGAKSVSETEHSICKSLPFRLGRPLTILRA